MPAWTFLLIAGAFAFSVVCCCGCTNRCFDNSDGEIAGATVVMVLTTVRNNNCNNCASYNGTYGLTFLSATIGPPPEDIQCTYQVLAPGPSFDLDCSPAGQGTCAGAIDKIVFSVAGIMGDGSLCERFYDLQIFAAGMTDPIAEWTDGPESAPIALASLSDIIPIFLTSNPVNCPGSVPDPCVFTDSPPGLSAM